MPIEFLDLLDDEGWERLSPDAGGGTSGAMHGPFAGAPPRVLEALGGPVLRSTRIDSAFGLAGLRLGPGVVVPRHQHDQKLLLLVFGGSLTVHTDAGGTTEADGGVDREDHEVGAAMFCVVDADTPYSLTAGAQAATLLSSWPQAVEPVTTWDPEPARLGATSEEQ